MKITTLTNFVLVILYSVFANAQSYSSSPAVGVATTCTSGSQTCSLGTWNGAMIRATVLSINSANGTAVVRIAKCTGTFLQSGTAYVKTAYCNSSPLASAPYSAGSSYVDIIVPLSHIGFGQSGALVATITSSTTDKYYAGTITMQNTSTCSNTAQWYSQLNSTWRSNTMGSSSCTIGGVGCAMTCVSMLLASTTGNTTSSYTPASLNTYLVNNGGYSSCNIYWATGAAMDGSGGLTYKGTIAGSWAALDAELSACRRVIVNVNNGAHWVLVIAKNGSSGVGSSYKVLDPGISTYTSKTLANFGNTFSQGRSYSGSWKSNMGYMPNATSPNAQEYTTYSTNDADGYLIPNEENIVTSTNTMTEIDNPIRIFPNPAQNTVAIANMNIVKTASVQVLNSIGQVVVAEADVQNNSVLNVENLPNGIYFIRFNIDDKIQGQPLLIRR